MFDIIRDAPVGQFIRFVSRNRVLKYPEELPDYKLPPQYAQAVGEKKTEEDHTGGSSNDELPVEPEDGVDSSRLATNSTTSATSGTNREELGLAEIHEFDAVALRRLSTAASVASALRQTPSRPIAPTKTSDGQILVDWYTTTDPENPHNWTVNKKMFVIAVLCIYTTTVYCAGPLWTASAPGIVDQFGVSWVAVSLGLALYVLAYGIGDLLFSPMTEIPVIGRNPVYVYTFIVFWALSFPTARTNNFSGLLALRFWLGFFGSPALANGGATVSDMLEPMFIPLGLAFWVMAAWVGPSVGPVLGGFAVMANGWHWPMWEVVWMSSLVLVILLLFMPETSEATILLHRAQRLRRITGDNRLMSKSEIDQRHMSASRIASDALIKPVEIMLKDPSIFFINLYMGYFYGVFYTFFEVFPLVFPVFYGFNLGQSGVAFLACLVGIAIAAICYFAYLRFYMLPDKIKNGFRAPEHRLVPAMPGSVFMTAGLFIFAWTARASIHWAVPLVGLGMFTIGHFWTMQALFIYIAFSYPRYAASLFAGNSIWRSGLGAAGVIFARPLFVNLGVARGVTLLGGLSAAGIIGTLLIYHYGKSLRARSTFAETY